MQSVITNSSKQICPSKAEDARAVFSVACKQQTNVCGYPKIANVDKQFLANRKPHSIFTQGSSCNSWNGEPSI